MAEARFCANCRAELPPRASACPACGVYAGDVYDGRAPVAVRTKRRRTLLNLLVLLIVVGAGVAFLETHPELIDLLMEKVKPAAAANTASAPVHVVRDRPGGAKQPAGAAISEPEAILILRRSFTIPPDSKGECVVISSQGYDGGMYNMTAFDRCAGTRLGRWQVDAKTGEVKRR